MSYSKIPDGHCSGILWPKTKRALSPFFVLFFLFSLNSVRKTVDTTIIYPSLFFEYWLFEKGLKHLLAYLRETQRILPRFKVLSATGNSFPS